MTIPVVDISSFGQSGSEKERIKTSRDLFDACHRLGFVYITGHGIPNALLEEAFQWTKRLFDLPHDEKMKAPHPPTPTPHRGYSAPGVETVYSKAELDESVAKGDNGSSLRKAVDFNESYEIGSDDNSLHPNIWLPESTLPGYQAFMTSFYWTLDQAAKRVLSALSLALNLTPSETAHLLSLHSGHNNELRLAHYPAVETSKMRDGAVARMSAHQDWSSFTFVFQDGTGGLELEDPKRKGHFVPATPAFRDACVLNIGDMMDRFSNGLFPSAMHRVTLPPAKSPAKGNAANGTAEVEKTVKPRYSIPYFVAPDNDAIVHVLPSCVSEGRPERYEPVKFDDYDEYLSKYMYGPSGKGAEGDDAGSEVNGVKI